MVLRYDCGEVITAMVTPMEMSGAIDYDRVESLAKHLIDSGSDALLVAGTTGESPTLTNEEEIELVSTVKRAVANKAKIILGAGSNSTHSAIEYSRFAEKEGVDAILSVVPYYNKPNQRGMVEHFSAIAISC
jgi:4-hydroxy-tetrahydrodipicolinate synthase